MDKKDIKQLLDQQTEGLQNYVDGRLTKQTEGLQNYVEGRLSTQTKDLQEYIKIRSSKQTEELHNDYNRQGKFLLDEFKHQTSVIAEQYTSLNKKIDGVVVMVAKNTEDIEIIKQDTGFIKSSLKRKVDLEEFEALEKRVILLERKFQSI